VLINKVEDLDGQGLSHKGEPWIGNHLGLVPSIEP